MPIGQGIAAGLRAKLKEKIESSETARGANGQPTMRAFSMSRDSDTPPRGVPEDSVVYAVGDVHGRPDLVRRLLARIGDDAAGRGARRRVIVFLGDYVDRGPDSAGVIELLLQGPPNGFEAHYLMGNHEDFMIRFLAGEPVGELWAMNGGDATLRSYGVDPYDSFSRTGGWEGMRRALAERMPDGHRRFLAGLALNYREGDVLFVHAGVRPGVPIVAQSAEDMLWIRKEFLESRKDFGALVVHGHTPTPEPEVRANRIGVDTGAYATGRLTAVALEGSERAFLST